MGLDQGICLNIKVSNRGNYALVQYKLLSVDGGNMQGVVQRELCSKDGTPDPGSMQKAAGQQQRLGTKVRSRWSSEGGHIMDQLPGCKNQG